VREGDVENKAQKKPPARHFRFVLSLSFCLVLCFVLFVFGGHLSINFAVCRYTYRSCHQVLLMSPFRFLLFIFLCFVLSFRDLVKGKGKGAKLLTVTYS
jgi:hypothetical protein